MSYNPIKTLPCGCRTEADYYGVEIKHCALHAAAPDLLAACKRGLAALTVAVEVGGGDPAEHECCRQMGLAIAKAEGGAS